MLVVRADGNAKIGAGHLMRCLTIADAVRRLSAREDVNANGSKEIMFICADEDSARLARDRGYRADVPGTGADIWSPGITGPNHTILVDHYDVTDAYLEGLQQYGKVFMLDDMQKHAYPVDGVINYNVFADAEIYQKLYAGQQTECFLGAKYAPLRERFQQVNYEIRPEVRQVLLTTGGGDWDNIAGQILDEVYSSDMVYHVLVGRFSPNFAYWQERMQAQPNIQVHYDVQDMAGMMQMCDLAITAGGSTIYELAAVGVPFVCFSYAENQEALVEYIGRAQTGGSAGAWHVDPAKCRKRIKEIYGNLCRDRELRRQYGARERTLTDGQGALRLAKILMAETGTTDRKNEG